MNKKKKTKRKKRAAPSKKTISKEMQTKISKVQQNNRIFLIQQKPRDGTTLVREFVIFGANGNVYTVKICYLPSCDCEDFHRGKNNCEHILFVYLKIFNVPPTDIRLVQKALLISELRPMLSSVTTMSPSILADSSITEKYLELTRVSRKTKPQVSQKPIEGDCPVCFEKMSTSQELVYCKYSCGNNIHQDCFHQWRTSRTDEHKDVRCIYCRAKWDQDWESIRNAHMKDGYLNLAEYRDHSLQSIPSYLILLPQLLRLSRMSIPFRTTRDDDDDGEILSDLENSDNE